MSREDPLEIWLSPNTNKLAPEVVAKRQAEAHAALDRLTDLVNKSPRKRADVSRAELWGWWGTVALTSVDLARAQELYRRIYILGGIGSKLVQEGLLNMISATEDPVTIPFWMEILDLNRPRDAFAGKRRILALATLARLFIRLNESLAGEALLKATGHNHPEVRALAIYYLGRAYREAGRSIPLEVLADLFDIALHDPAFGPRFQARWVLRTTNWTVPLDNAGGVYALKVRFIENKSISCTLELRSEQTLEDLHLAIQRTFGWNNNPALPDTSTRPGFPAEPDELIYAFYMNSQLYDEHYAVTRPYEKDNGLSNNKVALGELGLMPKKKFLYHFDCGNHYEFEVEVVDIRSQSESVMFPPI